MIMMKDHKFSQLDTKVAFWVGMVESVFHITFKFFVNSERKLSNVKGTKIYPTTYISSII